MKTNIIHNKSCLTMPEVEDNSVDTIITSPPYWGLRDYGTEANQIWGGDIECEHQWVKSIKKGISGETKSPKVKIKGKENFQVVLDTQNAFCSLCHAWHGQLGLEPTLSLYLDHLLQITAECKRVLKPTGVMWWVHGDNYGGSGHGTLSKAKVENCKESYLLPFGKNVTQKSTPKCLALQNYRLILRLIDEQGWILRNTIIWNKPNGIPSSVKDRLTNKYEPVFMLVKNKKYWFDLDSIREEHKYLEIEKRSKDFADKVHYGGQQVEMRGKNRFGRSRLEDFNPSGKNPGDVWSIPTQPYPEAHFATFPEKLIIKPILSSCPEWICKKCGKARVRIVKKTGEKYCQPDAFGRERNYQCAGDGQQEKGGGKGSQGFFTNVTETIGWTDCGCNAGWRPGIILDPFAGSGTTLAMAHRYHRQYIGYEVNQKYLKFIHKRIAKEDTLFSMERFDK